MKEIPGYVISLLKTVHIYKGDVSKHCEDAHKMKSKILIILQSLKILIIFKARSNLSSLEYLHSEEKLQQKCVTALAASI
jgi:hypothetical protein